MSQPHPVTWINSASGDKFPIQIDLNHPLWQTFLESGSVSPSQFFRMFFSPPTYFHSPTPWRSRNSQRLAQKVSELLDTFKPGTFSYRPFKKPMRSIAVIDTNNNSTEQDHENQNISATNGRPRPFYRRTSLTLRQETTEITHQNPKSLVENLRVHFIETYGLKRLKSILETSSTLPIVIQRLLLTLPCSDFEETCNPTECPTTYPIQCLLESNRKISYRASFFTSEVDKHASNLWMEYDEILKLKEKDGINPVLALAVDDLTENVFIITEDFSQIHNFKSEEIKSFIEKLCATIDKYPNLMIPKDIKTHLLYSTQDGILLQNPLLIKNRYLCRTSEENHNAIRNL